jgi:hypothetical protein
MTIRMNLSFEFNEEACCKMTSNELGYEIVTVAGVTQPRPTFHWDLSPLPPNYFDP